MKAGALNRQVKRNEDRFPEDFMLKLTEDEHESLRCQFGISKQGKGGRAIQMNISIMRTFTKLRSFLSMESSLKDEVGQLKKDTGQLFRIIFEKLDNLEDQITPNLPANRKKIGLQRNQRDNS